MEIIGLPIKVDFNGMVDYIYPTLIVQGDELTLVDTGYVGFLEIIENEINQRGYLCQNLKNIIITHYDTDHIGSLFAFKQKYPWVNIMSSAIEEKFINGSVKSERLVQAEERLKILPESELNFGQWFVSHLKELKHVPIDQTLKDKEMILHNQCQVLYTPGHTSGHMSLFMPEHDMIITGDAAVNENNQLVVANPQFCLDLEEAERSLNMLENMDAKAYYCYHGGKLTK